MQQSEHRSTKISVAVALVASLACLLVSPHAHAADSDDTAFEIVCASCTAADATDSLELTKRADSAPYAAIDSCAHAPTAPAPTLEHHRTTKPRGPPTPR